MAGWIINGVEFERPAGQRGAVFVYDDVLWDTAEHGLFCTALTVGSPEVRQNKREALARDGFIDLTEQFGRPVFGNRTISWQFLVTEEDWQTRCAEVREFIAELHGREVDILVDDYEGWTFTGRLSLERVTHQLDGTYIDIMADCDPFRRDGSEYLLPSDPTTFERGPAQHISVDAEAASYMRDPSSYTMTLAREGGGESIGVIASNARINSLAAAWGTQSQYGISYQTATCPASETVTDDVFGVVAAFTNLDVYVLPAVATSGDYALNNVSALQLRMKNGATTGSWVSILSRDNPVKAFEFRPVSGNTPKIDFELKATYTAANRKAAWYVSLWFFAVPAGDPAPSREQVITAWSEVICIETLEGSSEVIVPNAVNHAAPYEVFTTWASATISMSAIDTQIYDLTDYGHRYYALEATLPETNVPSDPYYIDIDGRRYYADDEPYTVKVNVGYRSRVLVYGSDFAVTLKGLAI